MSDFAEVWRRIEEHAGQEFHTVTGKPFTYRVPGAYLRVSRDGREINRSLSLTNFAKAAELMPVARPSDLADRQGPAYTWAILMDERIRRGSW
mgnify:CR=1 FL=1